MSYENLLEKAYSELPDVLKEHHRFERPVISSMIQGKTTVVQNLGEVSKAINRDTDMLAKFLFREFGTSGSHDGQHLFMKGQFRKDQIQERFDAFLDEYVLCGECGRPDTKIVREERVSFLKCEACGARQPLGALKTVSKKAESKKPEIGDEITVEITSLGRKGDGQARMGGYLVIVVSAKVGQKLKARITGVKGTMIFAAPIEVL